MKNLSMTLLALTFLTVSGCDSYVHGNGVFGADSREVPPFDGISVGLGITATVSAGATVRSVTISGDQNVLQYIDTNVVDGVLKTELSGAGGFDSVHQVQLVVATPELVRADAWGGAGVAVSGIDAASFTVTAAEGSSVTIAAGAGIADNALTVTASGTSSVDAVAYPALGATATLTGGSRADVFATGTVGGAVSEGSTLTVHGGGTCAVTIASGAVCQLAL